MGKKLAIDFGTSNTSISIWNETLDREEIIKLAHLSRKYKNPKIHYNDEIYCIPSIINFTSNKILTGQEVFYKGREFHEGTFREIKRYIMNRKPLPRDIGKGKKVSFYDAGETFLSTLILKTEELIKDKIQEVIFTLPVDAFQHYQEWLSNIAIKSGIKYYRLLDEPTACALGYNQSTEDGTIIMVFDFGGGTLDISIVKLQLKENKKSIVIGKSSANIGGIDIDTWLMEDLLKKNDLTIDSVQGIINLLRQNIEELKIELSFNDNASLSIFDDINGRLICGEYKREDFEKILSQNSMFSIIQDTIDDALEEAAIKGVRRSEIKEVLMVGGSSLIPSIKKALEERFSDKVKSYRPFDAVAAGACRYSAGKILEDYIKHNYSLRHWIWAEDRNTGEYGYQPFIKKGTRYPVRDIAKFKIDAAIPGQREIELNIFEVRDNNSQKCKNEIIYNSESGKYEIRNIGISGEEEKVIVNDKNPTFIKLDPPSRGGEKRISVSFSIDENRLLRVSVVDLKTNSMLYKEQPVVRLL